MSDDKKKAKNVEDNEVAPEAPEVEASDDAGEEDADALPNPFRFRRLDGQDPMKYEDVADK